MMPWSHGLLSDLLVIIILGTALNPFFVDFHLEAFRVGDDLRHLLVLSSHPLLGVDGGLATLDGHDVLVADLGGCVVAELVFGLVGEGLVVESLGYPVGLELGVNLLPQFVHTLNNI